MQDLNDMLYFAEVVDRGGFAAAGRALGIPKSKLSRRVAELEEAHARVLELEERLDFTERMLARGPDPVSVARPGEEAR